MSGFFLRADRGQTPARRVQVSSGKLVELFLGFSNGASPVEVGMIFRGRLQTNWRPLAWSLITNDEPATLTVDVSTKPFGSGSFTSIMSTEVPTLTNPEEESSDLITLWPDIAAGQWVEGKMGAITSGTPTFVGLTIWGQRI